MTNETRLVAVTKTFLNKKKGNKSYPVFSVVPNFEKGLEDEALDQIRQSLYYYTLPNRQTFISELEIILSDLYSCKVKF